MNYNTFESELEDLAAEIDHALEQRAQVEATIAWAEGFNVASANEELIRLRASREERKASLAELDGRLTEVESRMQVRSESARDLGQALDDLPGVFRRLSADYRRIKEARRAALREVARLHDRVEVVRIERTAAVDALGSVENKISDCEEALARYNGFQVTQANALLVEIDERQGKLHERQLELERRSADVERIVGPVASKLLDVESRMRTLESKRDRLSRKIADIVDQVEDAEEIREGLSSARDGSERAKLHRRCEKEFGTGSPGSVLKDLRRERGKLQSELRRIESESERLSRDHKKLTGRVQRMAKIANRNIGDLIIDGSNCCYQGSTLIGLRALVPLTTRLADRYPVTVVFDSSIPRRLSLDEETIQSILPAARVHVVAAVEADEPILNLASETETWVISNDRFADYPDKSAVSENRIIRHEIVNDRVIVQDLGVDEPLSGPLGPLA